MTEEEKRAKQREYHRAWYARNREAVKQRTRAWAKANPERASAAKRRWRENNREKDRESGRRTAQRPEYKARRCVYIREWQAANPEKYARKKWLNNARRRGVGYDIRGSDYAAILRSDPCSYCGDPGGVVDHIVPVRDGGDGNFDNLTAACRSCNARKTTKSLLHFMRDRLAA